MSYDNLGDRMNCIINIVHDNNTPTSSYVLLHSSRSM